MQSDSYVRVLCQAATCLLLGRHPQVAVARGRRLLMQIRHLHYEFIPGSHVPRPQKGKSSVLWRKGVFVGGCTCRLAFTLHPGYIAAGDPDGRSPCLNPSSSTCRGDGDTAAHT